MLANQMRGRAIRVDTHHPDKVSNIWHLATIDAQSGAFSYDLQQLASRFEGFEAPSYHGKHEIVSGIERVLDPNPLGGVPSTNFAIAKGRELTRKWWNDALYLGYANKLSTGVQAQGASVRSMRYTSYLYYVLLILSFIPFLSQLPSPIPLLGLVVILVLLTIILVRFLRTGTIAGVMKQVAIVILETLAAQGLIKTSLKRAGLKVSDEQGLLFVSCANLPAEENNLFIQALQEFLDPVDNPRYLLIRNSRFLRKIRQTDYFSIPSAISTNKRNIETFQKLWNKYIGKCEIVYTRSAEGRKVLLKARRRAFSATKLKASKRLSKWQ